MSVFDGRGASEKRLYQKDFGGESKDLEELRVQEQILRNRVLAANMNPSDIAKWKEVSNRIDEY